MTIDEQKKIFSENLSKYVIRSGKQQKEIAHELGISYTTFNTWMRGTSMPNAAKIQTLADYFGILKSDLLDDASKAEMEERLTEYAVKIEPSKSGEKPLFYAVLSKNSQLNCQLFLYI